jgi:hypothetical protein
MVEQAKVRERAGHFRGRAGVVIQQFATGDSFHGSIMLQAAGCRLPFGPQESYMLKHGMPADCMDEAKFPV